VALKKVAADVVDKLTSNPAAAFVGSTGDKATAVVG
jgi:hypothetical protein